MICTATSLRPLGDFAKVISGYAFKSAEFGEDGIPVIKIKNIRVGSVDLSDIARVSEQFLTLDAKYHVKTGDLLISLTGSHLTQPNSVVGRVARMGHNQPCCLLNQRAGKVILRDNVEADSDYLYYVLSAPQYSSAIAMMASGAASQANISPTQVESLEIPIPDLPNQRKIAGILSAYDDLIENNLRRIKILEEMAQSLYREWFVHFRFPGHESVKKVDSPLGQIPEGWEVKKLGEAFDISGGGTPSKKKDEYWEDGNIQWYSPRDLTAANTMFMEESANKITELGLQKSSAKLFPAYSVMLSSRATIGAIAINTVPSCTNQGFITCLPNERVPLYFLYQWLKSNVETFISHASGATFKEIGKGVFRELYFLFPPSDLVQYYEKYSIPIGDSLLNLQRRNQTLRQTRDLLLLKLIIP